MKKTIVLALVLYFPLGLEALPAEALPAGIFVVENRTAPAFALADMDGNRFSLNEARGHWVFVHFWASWCGPCRREMPAIERMAAHMDASMLRIVLVNTAESDDAVFTFLAGVAPSLNSLMDRDGTVTESWRPRGLPATYLVDPDGKLRYQVLGGRAWDEPVYLAFLRGLTKQD